MDALKKGNDNAKVVDPFYRIAGTFQRFLVPNSWEKVDIINFSRPRGQVGGWYATCPRDRAGKTTFR